MALPKKMVFVAAARPNFMKIAPMIREASRYPDLLKPILVHTGQHYDPAMSQTFFDQLGIPSPDINLEIGSGTHAQQTGQVMIRFEQFLLEEHPDMVVVVGDVNSTLACSLAATKLHIKVAHVEAGLRSFDRKMPEEINRLATDAIADLLFTTSEEASLQLQKEGIPDARIQFVGNVMIDTLIHQKERAIQSAYYKTLGLTEKKYALLTLHRPSNVDDQEILSRIFEALDVISKDFTIIFPVHPRTRNRIQEFNLVGKVNSEGIEPNTINLVNPLGYNEMLNLTYHAGLVLTDSGGLQEETTVLGIPCVTLRENTERPITVEVGTNILAGNRKDGILNAYQQARSKLSQAKIPTFWDGKASERIIQRLIEVIC